MRGTVARSATTWLSDDRMPYCPSVTSSEKPIRLRVGRGPPRTNPAPMRGTMANVAIDPANTASAMRPVAAKKAPPTTRREFRMRLTPTFWLGACAECLTR
jgi:hypothetical protein